MDHVEQAHDFTHPPTYDRQRGPGLDDDVPTFELEKGKRDGRQDDVMHPAGIRAPFEVIEAQIVFELAILLFDRPAAPVQGDQIDQRRRRRKMEQVVLPVISGRALAEQPPVAAALVGRTRNRTAR